MPQKIGFSMNEVSFWPARMLALFLAETPTYTGGDNADLTGQCTRDTTRKLEHLTAFAPTTPGALPGLRTGWRMGNFLDAGQICAFGIMASRCTLHRHGARKVTVRRDRA